VQEHVFAGRYRLLEPLGRGAMSSVWLAEDTELGRRVAVKMLGPAADRSRFDREARAVAALSHPHICQLYDYGESDRRPYMVLEYLPGGTLEDLMRGGKPLSDDQTQRIAGEIAAGLAHAHSRGLVHRDLKPANVLFDAEKRAKIADFGIARMDGGGTLTEAGTVLGTASYISPEQADGRPAIPASDVYSFGVILFRMLTGRLPFHSQNAMEVVRMHRDDPPPALASLRPDAPPRLESVTTASLSKNPAERPRDGRALLAALTGSSEDAATAQMAAPVAETQVAGPTEVLPRRGREPPRRSRLPLALGALAALLVAGGAVAFVSTRDGGSGEPTGPAPSLSLPSVPPDATTTAAPETTAPETTTETTITEATTTEPATTTEATTTAPTTTAPTTTEPATTAPATTTEPATTAPAPPPTTIPTTEPTAPTTTEPTTTEPTAPTTPTTTETVPTTVGTDTVTTDTGPPTETTGGSG
jgi:serine/threonine protein kinase